MTTAAAGTPAGPHARIEARLRLLEIEAQLQRTALAASLAQLEHKQPFAWLGTAASVAGAAGKVLSTPSMRWLVMGLAVRLFRHRRKQKVARKEADKDE